MFEPTRANVAHIVARTPIIFLLFIGITLGSAGVSAAIELAGDIRASRVDRADVFDYVSMQYERTDPEVGLVMSSTRVWHRDVEAASFVNLLRCEGVLVSEYSADVGPFEATPLSTQEWTYLAPFPTDGRRCHIESVIAAQYRGRVYTQRLESVPFQPIEGDR